MSNSVSKDKYCPFCGNPIGRDEKVCYFCGRIQPNTLSGIGKILLIIGIIGVALPFLVGYVLGAWWDGSYWIGPGTLELVFWVVNGVLILAGIVMLFL